MYNSVLEEEGIIESKTIALFLNKKELSIDEKNIRLKKVSDYLYSITFKFKRGDELSKFVSFLNQYEELFPPWITFPNMFQGSPRWNQGVE